MQLPSRSRLPTLYAKQNRHSFFQLRVGRHGLSVKEERGLARQERLRLRHPPEEAEGSANERGDGAGQWAAIKGRSRIEHVFAHLKSRMGLFVRTIGIARATMKIRMANLAYNITRYVWHEKQAASE